MTCTCKMASGVCCRCNRKGLCKGCSCVKAGCPCSGCLPGRLGQCSNSAPALVPPAVPVPSVPSALSSLPLPTVSVLPALPSSTAPVSSRSARDSSMQPNSSPRPPSLPPFETPADPSFMWGDLPGDECVQLVNNCYDEAIHWKPNLFKVPNGNDGEKFVKEMSPFPLLF